MSRVYRLGGRIFAPTEHLTARQDGYLMVQLSDTGLFDVLGKGLSKANEQEIAKELIVGAHRSGKFFHIIAGRLVEDGKRWNPKDAESNAEYFGDLATPDDKSQLTTAFVEVLTGFFLTVAASLTPSPSASTANPATPHPNQPTSDGASSMSNQDDTAGPNVPASSPMATASA